MAKSERVAGSSPHEADATKSEIQGGVGYAPRSEEQLRAITIGDPARPPGPIAIVAYDPGWPQRFAREAECVRAALGDRVLLLEHIGSTSVPGLAAKPWIDMVLVVADSADEPTYVPTLEAAGYVFRIREPDWYEHRMFRRSDPNSHLHVFSPHCAEVARMLRFRDRLRSSEPDRQLYERTKRELARREWTYLQHYADAKSVVVEEIIARAQRDDGSDPHEDS